METIILPAGRIEIKIPELVEGTRVNVVIAPVATAERFDSALAFLESLPAGPRAFPSWDAYEHHLKVERIAWDR
jgi:hypothetical protein